MRYRFDVTCKGPEEVEASDADAWTPSRGFSPITRSYLATYRKMSMGTGAMSDTLRASRWRSSLCQIEAQHRFEALALIEQPAVLAARAADEQSVVSRAFRIVQPAAAATPVAAAPHDSHTLAIAA